MKKILCLAVGALSTGFTLPVSANAGVYDFRVETKIHYRSSDDNRFPTVFPPGSALETVNAGNHFEISNIALSGKWQISENWLLRAKLDLIDLYDRNPTSSDREVDLDTFILRYGTRHTQGVLPEHIDFYAQIGKFGKFERQNDRRLETYGLVSTTFNRLEDSGLEFGIDLPSGLYAKFSYTTGSPLFFRDPNLLAGDNGVFDNPDEDIKSGIPLLYDAEIEDFDLSENPETGFGLGYRWLSDSGAYRVNVMLFDYRRDLADSVDLNGTIYGGDLDLLVVEPHELPPGTISENVGVTLDGRRKEESGINVWLYLDRLAIFAQHVEQSIADLDRSGSEIEISYAFDNVPFFESIVPAIRYSELDADFSGPGAFPAPSIWWDWTKTDIGINFDLSKSLRITAEHTITDFIRGGKTEENNETLLTLRWRTRF